MPPTTTNCGACALLLLLWIVGVGLRVCRRYFCKDGKKTEIRLGLTDEQFNKNPQVAEMHAF